MSNNHLIRPMNQAAQAPAQPDLPRYAQPVLGNPAATMMESGVGNCFPGLEFDLRQLDVRFFPGLVFAFPGITPAGPDGTQGAQLVYADTGDDPIFDLPHKWLAELKNTINGPQGSALGSGQWYLHWVEQGGNRIEMYQPTVWQNGVTKTAYEGEIAWWIIRLIEVDPDPQVADLTIALTQRDAAGQPSGHPVILKGKRRSYLDGEGMIPDVYRPGELTASMCSPWTHDFRDCACQYWASNHPDVALGEVADPNGADIEKHNPDVPVPGGELPDHTSAEDPGQALGFLDWMRRRSDPSRDITAAPTIELARPGRYDPYEINLHWEELDFVLQGQEVLETPLPEAPKPPEKTYDSVHEVVQDLSENLAGLEFTLSMEYLYAFFSLRAPDEVTPRQETDWPGLTNDLRAARQLVLSVAISEMTHLRWVNQTLWTLCNTVGEGLGPYVPVIAPASHVPAPDGTEVDFVSDEGEPMRKRALRPATPEVIHSFVEVERPGGDVDTEYASLVAYLRTAPDVYPVGLYQLAVRIDSDGLNHYQKFRDVARILKPYELFPDVYLRPVQEAAPDDPAVAPALAHLDAAVEALRAGYDAEARSSDSNEARAASESLILEARAHMHALHDCAEQLARDHNIGVPFFAHAGHYGAQS